MSHTVREYMILHGDPCLVTYEKTDFARNIIDTKPIEGDFAIAYDSNENLLLKHGAASWVGRYAANMRERLQSSCPDIAEALSLLTIPRHALTEEVLKLVNRTLDCTGQVHRLIEDLQKVTSIPPAPPSVPA